MAENNRVRQSKLGLGGKMYRLGLGSMSKDREGGSKLATHNNNNDSDNVQEMIIIITILRQK